jgi:hypothetical protein
MGNNSYHYLPVCTDLKTQYDTVEERKWSKYQSCRSWAFTLPLVQSTTFFAVLRLLLNDLFASGVPCMKMAGSERGRETGGKARNKFSKATP